MTVSGVPHGGVVVERSGACLSIRAAAAPAGRRPEAMLPAEPGRTAVVVDDAAAAALHALDRGLLGDLDRHLWTPPGGRRQGLRLLVGGAARSGVDGAAPLAARLAAELGVEVVAPDGPLVVLRRGELFSAGAAAAWWGFAAGRWPERAGPRFPSPAWQRDLPADLGARTSGLVTVTPVPSGLWVRAAGGPAAELSDPGFAVPPAAQRLAVLVGRPGEARPAVAGLAEVIGGLPPALRQRYVLVPYGPEPAGQAPVGQELADRLGVDVRATHGLPYYTEDGSLDFALVDDAGRFTWRPPVTESVYHPGAQPPTRSTRSPALRPPVQYPATATVPGYAETRPDSVGRLHASAVPTVAGPATAPPPPAASAVPANPPDLSTADDRSGGPAGAAGHPSTADEASAGSPPVPAGSGDSSPAATSAPAAPGAGRPVTIRPDGRIRPVHGQQHRGNRNEPNAGGPPAAPTAAPAGRTLPAPHPPGPGRPPQPSPPTAPSPAPAGAAPPTSPSQAEQPLLTPAPHRRPPPAADQPRDSGPATAPDASVSGGAVAGAAGLVLVTPERVGGVDGWWRRPCTLAERQQFRLSLGWRFDAASRYVTRLLSQRPGLRAVTAGDEGVATDLAAVHVFAASDHTDLVESLRTGAVRPVDRAFLSCVVSGLRWLPTLTGLVVRGGPEDPAAAEAYLPGSEVVEMGLLLAVADPVAEVPGGVEVLIWSSTARRLDGLVEGGEGAQVVFLPGTVFRVLEVDRAAERRRVLLAEVPQNWRGQADPGRDERIRGRLRAAARVRTADPADGDGADGGDAGGGGGAGDAEEKAPARRCTGRGLVGLPGLVPAESLSGAA